MEPSLLRNMATGEDPARADSEWMAQVGEASRPKSVAPRRSHQEATMAGIMESIAARKQRPNTDLTAAQVAALRQKVLAIGQKTANPDQRAA